MFTKSVFNLAGFAISMFLLTAVSVYSMSSDNLKNQIVLNSSASEDRPLVTADGKKMFFNSCRKNNFEQNLYGYDNYEKCYRYDYDIYYSIKNGDVWTEPKNLGYNINSSTDDGVLSISPDGQTIYFLSFKVGYEFDGGPFYKAELHGNEWTNVKGLGGGITKFYLEGNFVNYDTPNGNELVKYIAGASISPDGKHFYFSTDINRIYGKMDIWVSDLIDGVWSEPMNLGPIINAKNADNMEPYISLDNKTLYYNTNGLGGYGGRDIFYSIKEDGDWTKPKNLGKEINSEFDDRQISIPACGNIIYVGRENKAESKHNDIYSALVPEDVEYLPNVTVVRGKVLDKETHKPIEAKITINNKTLDKVSYTTWSNASTGEYVAVIQAGAEYNITFEKENYSATSNYYDIEHGVNENDVVANCHLEPFHASDEQTSAVKGDITNDNNDINIYPNPFNEKINISVKGIGNFNTGEIIISNIYGVRLITLDLNESKQDNYTIDLSDFADGIYFIQIKSQNINRVYKVIKN